jgi:hypothetical protein
MDLITNFDRIHTTELDAEQSKMRDIITANANSYTIFIAHKQKETNRNAD